MAGPAIQDLYPDELSHCYGCGRLNEHGLQLKSRWEGEELVATFRPEPYHVAIPGFVYGGLLASLIDCHGVGMASAAAARTAGREPAPGEAVRYVTASLKVDFLRPTPMGTALELRARARPHRGRSVTVDVRLSAGGVETARGEVVAVQLPADMRPGGEGAR
jgi:acyl-coenzyme A thioesterase PaaI-like protein